LKVHGAHALIGEGPACVWTMPIVQGFAALFYNPDIHRTLEVVAKTQQKNLHAEDFKVILRPQSDSLFLFNSIDKTQQAKLTITFKSAVFIAQEDILRCASLLKPESLLYKKRPIHIDMYTVETPTHIHFLFDSKQDKLFSFEQKFQTKGLLME